MAAFSTLAALAVGGAGLVGGAMQASAANKGAKAQNKAANQSIAEQRRQFEVMRSYLDPVYTDSRLANSFYMTALGLYPDTNYRPPSAAPAQPAQPAQQTNNRPTGGSVFQRMAAENQPPQQAQVQNADGQTAATPYTPGKTASDIVSMVQQSPGYQTQMQEGINAVDRAAAGSGGLMSGRRLMALNDVGQKTFGSFYNQWLDRVGGVAGQGGQIAGAIGQGAQSMANNVSNLMTNRGNAKAAGYQNAASAWGGALGDVAGAAGWWAGQQPMTKGFG